MRVSVCLGAILIPEYLDSHSGYSAPRSRIARIYINNSRHLARKYVRIFVRGHYLFREANSFPRAKFQENCELRGTDNVQGQISEHNFAPNGDNCVYIFAPNGGYGLYYPSNLLRNARNFQNWGIFSDIPSFSWGMFGHVTRLDQSRASEKI